MKHFLLLFFLVGFITLLQAQKLSDWQYRQEDKVISLNPPHFETSLKVVSSRAQATRLPIVYEYASVPVKNESKWKLAPSSAGKVNFSIPSRLNKANYDNFTKEIDITYFRAFLDLRGVNDPNMIKSVTVSIGLIDDQARMLIYNSNNDATFVPAKDAVRGGKDFTVDFTTYVKLNEINTFVIVQVDDNCCGNNLTGGITVKLNNTELIPTPAWVKDNTSWITESPDYTKDKPVEIPLANFNVNAFSVNQGQGKGLWFFGVNNGDATGRIIQKGAEGTTLIAINKVIVDDKNKVYAFKVTNYSACPGKSAYLTANQNGTVSMECVDDSKGPQSLPAGAQFMSITAFTKELGSNTYSSFESKIKNAANQKLYLRHRGLILYVDPESPDELFRQDASWKIVPPTN